MLLFHRKIEMLKAKDREYEAAFMKAQELKRYEDRKEYSKHVAYFKGVVSAMKADQSE